MKDKTFPQCPFEPLRRSFLSRDDEFFMSLAYNQALKAWEAGEIPVGAVIEHGGEVVAQAHNMVETLQDPTAHAEILAITQAAKNIGDWRLNGSTLYVTKEPCPMCSGAAVMSRVSRVVFGAPDKKMGFMGGAAKFHEMSGLNHKTVVADLVLKDECVNLIKTYFLLKRKLSNNPNPSEQDDELCS
ncbi:MAG: nucleoside deaminase [Opitutales bacterium]|nr:nucleoside deaminase [Opitutales bacterium]